MTTAEHLRAKSIQTQVAYTRDLQQLSFARNQEERCLQTLRTQENQFWRSALLSAKVPAKAAQTVQAPSLDRLMQSHMQLKEARNELSKCQSSVQCAYQSLTVTQNRLDLLTKLMTECSHQRHQRDTEGIAEEISELAVQTRHSSSHLSPQDYAGNNGDTSLALNAFQDISRQLPKIPCISFTLPAGTSAAFAGKVDMLPPLVTEISVQQAPEIKGLTISCNFRGFGPLSLQISQASGSRINCTLDTHAGALLPLLLRDRSVLQTRLQALGLHIQSFDITSSSSTSSSPSKRQRPTTKEEEDEDTLT